ncbi:hypothetical protein CFP56_019467 [Quercus suber]|uniref:Uncharacterized protein n=1 Tax=Quercus suber TaxID=58331 RepID=A0AAW0KJ29_QUESU
MHCTDSRSRLCLTSQSKLLTSWQFKLKPLLFISLILFTLLPLCLHLYLFSLDHSGQCQWLQNLKELESLLNSLASPTPMITSNLGYV